MIYSKPGPDSDLYMAFTHMGQYEIHGVFPNGHICGFTVPDVATAMARLEYMRVRHVRFDPTIRDKLEAELVALIREEREQHS